MAPRPSAAQPRTVSARPARPGLRLAPGAARAAEPRRGREREPAAGALRHPHGSRDRRQERGEHLAALPPASCLALAPGEGGGVGFSLFYPGLQELAFGPFAFYGVRWWDTYGRLSGQNMSSH